MIRSKFFLVFMMFVGVQSECMELIKEDPQDGLLLKEDILCNEVRPYLTLQSIARFGQTCKRYEKIFDPGNIDHVVPGLLNIQQDYYYCTQVLGGFAQHNNKRMFELLWESDDVQLRRNDIARLGGPTNSVDNAMIKYHKYYSNYDTFDEEMAVFLKCIFCNCPYKMIVRILPKLRKKYTIFELFSLRGVWFHTDDNAMKNVFNTLLLVARDSGVEAILPLLPQENGEHKNRTVQYLLQLLNDSYFRNGELDTKILNELLKRGYLSVDEEYGNKCTLLHYVALMGNSRLLDGVLFFRNPAIHAINAWGKQPLDYAYKFAKSHCHFCKYKVNKDDEKDSGIVTFFKYLLGVEDEEKRCCDMCHKFFIVDSLKQMCKAYCKDKEQCVAIKQVSLKFSEEEIAWLRNYCNYPLEKK